MSTRRPLSRRTSMRTPFSVSSVVIGGSTLMLLGAMVHGVLVPPHALACGAIMLAALAPVAFARKR